MGRTRGAGTVTAAGVVVFGRASEVVKVLGERVHLAAVEAKLAPWLDAFCRAVLSPYERPGRAVLLKRIPRTELGKCCRELLAIEVRDKLRA